MTLATEVADLLLGREHGGLAEDGDAALAEVEDGALHHTVGSDLGRGGFELPGLDR